tara:strand:- start:847 stop:1215 length:369 start_codon:yes stop_codon:yes gene_type:complete
MKKNNIYIGVALVLAGFIVYQNRKKIFGMSEKPTSSPGSIGGQVKIRNAAKSGAGNFYAIKTADRKSQKDTKFVVGSVGMINGTQKCTISKLKKVDGKITAFQCEEIAPGSYNIADGSIFSF